MHPPIRPIPRPRRIVAGLSALVVAAGLAAGAVTAPAGAEEGEAADVTMVQAHIKVAMADWRFTSDVREVLSGTPDFISYNEVPYRDPDALAPDGYSLHRNLRNKYTRATPVAWKHPEWTKVEAGSFRISNIHEIPDGTPVRIRA